jgi:hypothetical protein
MGCVLPENADVEGLVRCSSDESLPCNGSKGQETKKIRSQALWDRREIYTAGEQQMSIYLSTPNVCEQRKETQRMDGSAENQDSSSRPHATAGDKVGWREGWGCWAHVMESNGAWRASMPGYIIDSFQSSPPPSRGPPAINAQGPRFPASSLFCAQKTSASR